MNKSIRIYEPYGFRETDDYRSVVNAIDNEIRKNREVDEKQELDITKLFASAQYSTDRNSIIFYNLDGTEKGAVSMQDIVPSSVKEAYYDKDSQTIVIKFDNNNTVEINLSDIINIDEAGDGLVLDNNKFNIKIDETTQPYVEVSENGIKIVGIDEVISAEAQQREESDENEKIERESADNTLSAKIETEINRATNAENTEITVREAADKALGEKIDAEEKRAETAEQTLNNAVTLINSTISSIQQNLNDEINRSKSKDEELENNKQDNLTPINGIEINDSNEIGIINNTVFDCGYFA